MKTPSLAGRAARWTCLRASVVVSALTLLAALGVLLDPSRTTFAMLSAIVWTSIGPHLVVSSGLGILIGVVDRRRERSGIGLATAVLGFGAMIASITIVAKITSAIDAAGGSANPVAALWISSMTAAAPDARETYPSFDGRQLGASIYRPTTNLENRAAPILFYIHGGGWVSGSAEDTAADLRFYADQGLLVISIDYRLATSSIPTWDTTPKDVACALIWTQENAARLGGDSSRIVVLGESAGGNLAINVAYAAALGSSSPSCAGVVPRALAVIAAYPVVEPQNAYEHPGPISQASPRAFIPQYLGGAPETFPDRLRAISSATYLSGNAPPTLIIEPELDGLVAPEGVYRFVDRARAAGVDVTLVRIPFANHGFDVGLLSTRAAGSLGNRARTIVRHYLAENKLLP